MMSNDTSRGRLLWLIYAALILAGIILIGDAVDLRLITKLTARLGVALVFSAVALLVGKNRPHGIIATAIIWVAVIITFFN
jgi:hypothetical protein